jgi:putative hemolysin
MIPQTIWLEQVFIFILILANGFFAAAEIAIIAMRKSRIDALLEKGTKCAAAIARLKNDPDRFLATVQIGVTVVSSLASAIGGAAAIAYLQPKVAALPIPIIARWSELIAIFLVVLPISYFSLFGFSEPVMQVPSCPPLLVVMCMLPVDRYSDVFEMVP